MKKRFLALFLMTLMVLPFVTAAAAAAPGTRQKLTTEELEDGDFFAYHAVENGKTLTVYCFNSDLQWPVSSPTFDSDYYVPDEMLHLSDEVKDKIYRILYAGYPHNNLGLYSSSDSPVTPTMEELSEACVPPQAIKDLMTDVDWSSLRFTPKRLMRNSREAQVMSEIAYKVSFGFDEDYFNAAMAKPNFYALASAYAYMVPEDNTVDDLLMMYGWSLPSTTPGAAHDATQKAIWRILYENNVPNNPKDFSSDLKSNQLIRDLVDFANGVGDYKDAYIPPRGTTIAEMQAYKSNFETGAKLLREDGSPVSSGTIVFTENADGVYESEPLHFADDIYSMPYQISLIDTDDHEEIVSVVNHGAGEFVLKADYRPDHARISVTTDNYFPSDIYQYVHENQANIPADELDHDHHYQDMSGCYFESVPLNLEIASVFHERTGSLKVTKKVNGKAVSGIASFNFKVTLSDTTINGTFGEMTFTNGVAEFSLTNGASMTAEGLPEGVEYTVVEQDYTGYGYETDWDTNKGHIAADQTMESNFTNTRNADGSLTVRKMLEGNDVDHNKEFTFRITVGSVSGNYSGVHFSDGKATIRLKGGEHKVIEGLPHGLSYTVEEVDPGDGYTTEKHGDPGTIDEKKPAVFEFINTRDTYGKLTVSKTVDGSAGDKTKEFHFEVLLSDTTITGTHGDMTFHNGHAAFTLKHGQSKTATGLPNGVDYIVKETDYTAEGYETESNGHEGSVIGNSTVYADFTNTRNAADTLTIYKHLDGNDIEPDREFTFLITLYPKITGVYSGVRFTEGSATIQLKGAQHKVIEGLPNGTAYTITETEANTDGYVTIVHGVTGTVSKTKAVVAEVINTRNTYGSLIVEKKLSGAGAESDREFYFTVELSDKGINGTYGQMHFANGIAGFYLKDGQSMKATDLPNGVEYTVTERDYTDEGYKTESTGAEGKIEGNKTHTATFINYRDALGNLSVTKIVKADKSFDMSRLFHFVVKLSDPSINGSYGQMRFVNGKAEIYLKHNQTATAEGLPSGIEYTVLELKDPEIEFRVRAKNNEGTIVGNRTQQVEFINVAPASPVPKTGDKTNPLLWCMALTLSLVGLMAGLAAGKRKHS